MACEIIESAADQCWNALLELRQFLEQPAGSHTQTCVYLCEQASSWSLVADRQPNREHPLVEIPLQQDTTPPTAPAFHQSRFEAGQEPLLNAESLPPSVAAFLRLYLPILLGAYRNRLRGRPFVTAHLAQSLDGCIACSNGQSQWISNRANLHHSHRLRALHQAVMVGGRTVERDDPMLTVRHVKGRNPRRVILNSSGSVLRTAAGLKVLSGAGSTLICDESAPAEVSADQKVEVIPLPPSVNSSWIPPGEICNTLQACGVNSLFLEGGAQTLSRFLETKSIDILHIHLAPVILGSGIRGFSLPEVQSVQDAQRVSMQHFAMDGEILVECRPHTTAEHQG